jgi:lipid II:glycine glycyltransferase (peptidoglycan interpeptide bridge formation enzyme)
MQIRFATTEEISAWDSLIISNPDGGNIFQSASFANIKNSYRHSWTPRYMIADDLYFVALERKIPILGKFWYIPKGPGVSTETELIRTLEKIKSFAKENRIFLVKTEPEIKKTAAALSKIKNSNLYISRGIQAASTIIIDIDKPIDDIMASFSSKTRYNIRSADKSGLISEITPINDITCKEFYKMMAETINGRSPLRDFAYYKLFWETHSNSKTGFFMFAKKDNQIISMDFINILGEKASRKDAASTRDHSIHGASAWLELEVIKYLKTKNIKEYDLYGSPPSDRIKDPTHPFYGFGNFKAGFNKEVTDYIGCIDMPVKRFVYEIWKRYGEKIVRRLYRSLYNEAFY